GCSSNANITVNVPDAPNAGTITTTSTSLCESGSVMLTLNNFTAGASIQWEQSSTSGGPYTDISGATNSSYQTPVITSTQYFVAKVSCVNSSLSPEIAVEVLAHPSPPIAFGGSHCSPGIVTLQASGTGNLNWYNAPTGGQFLNSGTFFQT